MTTDALHSRLEAVFRDVLGLPGLELQDSTTAADVDEWDSLAHVNLLFALEEEFGVTFRQEEMGSLGDVGELKALLAARSSA